jgi:tRNA(fMet)-specific endonuclease VapC
VSYLLDTDICIYWLNGRQNVRDRLLEVGWDEVTTSVIIQAELYYGAYNSSQVTDNLSRVDAFINGVVVLSLHEETLKRFGKLKAHLRQMGQPLADFDLLIASTALVENKILVTNNTRHYKRIPDLKLENWMNESDK